MSDLSRRQALLLAAALPMRGLGDAADPVAAAETALAAAFVTGDAAAIAGFYLPAARSCVDAQPALRGRAAILAYRQRMLQSRRARDLVFSPMGRVDLGETSVTYGTWVEQRLWADGAAERIEGNYIHVWRGAGKPRLLADVMGYAARRARPDQDHVAELVAEDAGVSPSGGDPAVAAELAALNARIARGVATHDAEARLSVYANDAVIMPFAERPLSTMARIAPYLRAYVANGSGATFQVKVYNDGFEVLPGHVLEYSRFRVDWRAGQDGGVVSGGGLRLWRREADGALRMRLEGGAHDYRA